MTRIFREKNMGNVVSPDRLDEYIKVSSLSVWLILAVAVLLIAAGIIWAWFGNLTETQQGMLVVDGAAGTCYIAQDDAAGLSVGDEVSVQGATGTVVSVSPNATPASALPADADAESDWYVPATVAIDLPDGVYDASVATESYSPIDLLLGQGR